MFCVRCWSRTCSNRTSALSVCRQRRSRKGLGDIYQGLVNVRTTDQLVEDGWLVPFKIYVGTTIDMAGAKTTGGEWRDSEVSERTLPVIGDIVSEWRKKTHEVFGEGRTPKTLVFSASVANGADLCREFQNIGVTCRTDQLSRSG